MAVLARELLALLALQTLVATSLQAAAVALVRELPHTHLPLAPAAATALDRPLPPQAVATSWQAAAVAVAVALAQEVPHTQAPLAPATAAWVVAAPVRLPP